MNYKKHYDKLIIRAQNRTITGYTEKHHIIPKCMGGDNSIENLVRLTPEEHYVAHQLLVKIYPDNIKLVYAASMMTAGRMTNKSYGWISKLLSEHMKNNNPNANGKVNISRAGKYNISAQAKKNISEGLKASNANVGSKNGMFGIMPWNHPRATIVTKSMWANADMYYDWWVLSGLDHGQNAMARAFNEKYMGTHTNLIKYFRNGWIPTEDREWIKFKQLKEIYSEFR